MPITRISGGVQPTDEYFSVSDADASAAVPVTPADRMLAPGQFQALPFHDKKAVASSTQDVTLMEFISRSSSPLIRSALAMNPSLDFDIAGRMYCTDADESVVAAVAMSPNAGVIICSQDALRTVREAIPLSVGGDLPENGLCGTAEALACCYPFSEEDFGVLLRDCEASGNERNRFFSCLLANPNCPPEFFCCACRELENLPWGWFAGVNPAYVDKERLSAALGETGVRGLLAFLANPHLGGMTELLAEVEKSRACDVLVSSLLNPEQYDEFAQLSLVSAADFITLRQAGNAFDGPGFYNSDSELARFLPAVFSSDLEVLDILSRDADDRVRCAVAGNPHVDADIAQRLVREQWLPVFRNPAAAPFLTASSSTILNPGLSPEQFETLDKPYNHSALAANLSCPPAMLTHIIEEAEDVQDVLWAVDNPNADADVLDVASRCPYAKARLRCLDKGLFADAGVQRLLADSEPSVRRRAADVCRERGIAAPTLRERRGMRI